MILLNPGPVNVSPRVTAALGRGDLCHREPECTALLERIRNRLLEAFAPRAGFTAVLITGSGTAAVEAAVTSVCSERGRLAVVCNGIYGERIVAMATAAHIPVTRVESAWIAPPDLDAVEAALRAPDVEAIAVVHHETTTGLINPVAEIARRARALGKLVLVDAVSGLGGDPLDATEVDLVVGTGGKCIQAFPGMAFVLVRQDLLDRLATYPRRSVYLSLATYTASAMPFTPAVQVAYALDEALAELLEETVAGRIARYRRRGGAPARRIRALGARARSPGRAALEHHHLAPLPARSELPRAARCAQGAWVRDLRGTGVVREGGVPGGEHGRAAARRPGGVPGRAR